MPTPTILKSTTRPAVGLTGKGRAYAILLQVRDRWGTLNPDQQAECAELLDRLQAAMRREQMSFRKDSPRPLPLVARISA